MRLKKAIVVILVVCMLIPQALSSAAVNEKAMFDLISMDIIEENVPVSHQVTRSEFAGIMVKLMNLQEAAAHTQNSSFVDIRQDKNAGAIILLNNLGLINGFSQTVFKPEEYITYPQAVKILVCALGYGAIMNQPADYPTDYLIMAAKIGLDKGVSSKETFTYETLITLLYNTLDISMVVRENITGGSYMIDKNETLRNLHLEKRAGNILYKETGVVTANIQTWLNAPGKNIKSNQVEIDDVRYLIGSTDAAVFIGQEVEFYAEEDENGNPVLKAIRATKNNTVVTVHKTDILSLSFSKIKYQVNENDSEEEFDVSGNVKVIKNGRRILIPKPEDLNVSQGSITFIDNNGDLVADILFIEEYVNIKVANVSEQTIELAPGYLYKGTRFIPIDLEDKDLQYYFYDDNRSAIELSDIQKDNILSLMVDAGGNIYTFIVSDKVAEGYISEYNEETIYVDGEMYRLYQNSNPEIKIGEYAQIFLDYKGYAADIKYGETGHNYAYLAGVQSEGSLIAELQVKLILGNEMIYETEENKSNLDDKNLIPILKCQNSGVGIFTLAKSVRIGEKRPKDVAAQRAELIVGGIYKYQLDIDGKITKLIPLAAYGGSEGMTYNANEMVFSGGKVISGNDPIPFAINLETVCINVPTNAVSSDKDYMVPLEISNKVSDTTFNVFGYDLEDNNKKVRLMVFENKMNSNEVLTVSSERSNAEIGMVTEKVLMLDQEGETVHKIKLMTAKGEQEFVAHYVPGKNDVLTTLQNGDLIYYVKSLSGEMDHAVVIHSFKNGLTAFHKFLESVDEQKSGYITDISYDDIEKDTLVTTLKLGGLDVAVRQRNTPVIFKYDSHTQKVSLASMKDLVPGTRDMFYALVPYGQVKAAVIYR